MKKLIALSAVAVMASSAAMADVAITGAASVSYDDNGSKASATTYDADLTFVGSSGATTLTASMDIDGTLAMTAIDLSTSVGPVTIAADMHQTVETTLDDGDGDGRATSDDTGVTISLDVPVGDITLAVDNSGNVTISGTTAGVTLSHTVADLATTSLTASLAGVDVTVTRSESSTTAFASSDQTLYDAVTAEASGYTKSTGLGSDGTLGKGAITESSSTTWSLSTTVSGVALTLNSGNDISATFGLAGNTMVVSHFGEDAAVAANYHSYGVEKNCSILNSCNHT